MKVISYRYQEKSGVGVVVGADGVVALSKAAPDLPDDLRKILEVDPTLETVRAATNARAADLSLNDIEFEPVIREPHATWALALNYKLGVGRDRYDNLSGLSAGFSCACRFARSG